MLTLAADSGFLTTFALEPQTQILGFRPEARKVVQALAGFSVFNGCSLNPDDCARLVAARLLQTNKGDRAIEVGNPLPLPYKIGRVVRGFSGAVVWIQRTEASASRKAPSRKHGAQKTVRQQSTGTEQRGWQTDARGLVLSQSSRVQFPAFTAISERNGFTFQMRHRMTGRRSCRQNVGRNSVLDTSRKSRKDRAFQLPIYPGNGWIVPCSFFPIERLRLSTNE